MIRVRRSLYCFRRITDSHLAIKKCFTHIVCILYHQVSHEMGTLDSSKALPEYKHPSNCSQQVRRYQINRTIIDLVSESVIVDNRLKVLLYVIRININPQRYFKKTRIIVWNAGKHYYRQPTHSRGCSMVVNPQGEVYYAFKDCLKNN